MIILCCQGHFLQPQLELILLSDQGLRMIAEGHASMTSKQAELQCSMLYDKQVRHYMQLAQQSIQAVRAC